MKGANGWKPGMKLSVETFRALALQERMALLFEEQTRILRGCLFEVHNEVGPGYPEEAMKCGNGLRSESVSSVETFHPLARKL